METGVFLTQRLLWTLQAVDILMVSYSGPGGLPRMAPQFMLWISVISIEIPHVADVAYVFNDLRCIYIVYIIILYIIL